MTINIPDWLITLAKFGGVAALLVLVFLGVLFILIFKDWRMMSIAALLTILPSCVSYPTVSRTMPNGSIYTASAGTVFMAEQENVIAHVKTAEGDEIKFAVKKTDSTKVPIALGRQLMAAMGLYWAAASEQAKTAADEATTLGAQASELSKFQSAEETKRLGMQLQHEAAMAELVPAP